jgi:hypothetical protein
MKTEPATIAVLAAALSGCAGSGDEFVLTPTSDAPAIADYGELEVIPAAEWEKLGPQAAIDTYGFHGTIGAPESGHFGGGTFRFLGNGGNVCVFTDMELVFWGQSISPIQPNLNYAYSDNYNDDGDIDLFSGISAFYTGSPGVEMGDFYGVYTDSQGQQTTLAYNECLQTGGKPGFNESHGGRGAPEYCTLDTDQRDGVEFTVALQTFAVPLDDGKLDFVTAVVALDGNDTCGDLNLTECTYLGETFLGDRAQEDYDIEVVGMESAFCATDVSQYCCEFEDEYPDLCGDPPDSTFCEQFDEKK